MFLGIRRKEAEINKIDNLQEKTESCIINTESKYYPFCFNLYFLLPLFCLIPYHAY